MSSDRKSIAIISYNDWFSDGRAKASGNVYAELGYDLLVFCSREEGHPKKRRGGDQTIWNGINKYSGQNLFLYFLYHIIFMGQAAIWLIKAALKHEVVIIHIHNMPDYLILVGLIGKIQGIKIVWDLRDITPAVFFTKNNPDSLNPNGLMYKIMLFIQKLCGSIADEILTADKIQKKYLIDCGFPEKKVHVFMNLPLKEHFSWLGPCKEKIPFRLVYHGTLTHRLGLDIAIRAVDLVKSKINILFDILGDGDSADELEKLINELHVSDVVHLTRGFVAIENIPPWVEGACGAIISNRKTYATNYFMLPHKMLEYITLGIPVIAPRLNNIQSYFSSDQAVFYEPGNIDELAAAILKLYNCDRMRLALKAKEFFDGNNYFNNVDAIKQVIV